MAVNGILLRQNNDVEGLKGKFLSEKILSPPFKTQISKSFTNYYLCVHKNYILILNGDKQMQRYKINFSSNTDNFLTLDKTLTFPGEYSEAEYCCCFASIKNECPVIANTYSSNIFLSFDDGVTWKADINNFNFNSCTSSIGDGYVYTTNKKDKFYQISVSNNNLIINKTISKPSSFPRDFYNGITSAITDDYYSPNSYLIHIPSGKSFSKNTRYDSKKFYGTENHIWETDSSTNLKCYSLTDSSLANPLQTFSLKDASALQFTYNKIFFYVKEEDKLYIVNDKDLSIEKVSITYSNLNLTNNREHFWVEVPLNETQTVLIYLNYSSNTWMGWYTVYTTFIEKISQYELYLNNKAIGKIPSDLEISTLQQNS